MPPQTLTIITPPNSTNAPLTPTHWILLIGPHSSSSTPFYTVLHILATESGYTTTVEQDDGAKLDILNAAAAAPDACLAVCAVPRGREGYRVFEALEWALQNGYRHGSGNEYRNGNGCLWVEVFLAVLVEWGWMV